MLKRWLIPGLAIFLIVLCASSLLHLFLLRFESGDVYAEYSSLRSDPKGCKVLCESLRRLPDVSVTRNLRDLSRWSEQEIGQTLLFAGYNLWWFQIQDPTYVERLWDLAAQGNRLVIALKPTTMRRPNENDEETAEKLKKWMEKDGEPTEEEETLQEDRPWKVDLEFVKLSENPLGHFARFLPEGSTNEETLPWNTTTTFLNPDDGWSIVGSHDERPTILEQKVGQGSIVLCADSYFLSNEALLHERATGFLIWLIGPHRSIVFDETHLGIASNPGVASLIRQYRLHGLVASLLLLAALFIWKNLWSLAPRQDDPAQSDVIGKDQAEGLVNLLRHHIPSSQLMGECNRVWQHAARFLPHVGSARREEIQTVLEQKTNSRPEDTYRQLQKLLHKRN